MPVAPLTMKDDLHSSAAANTSAYSTTAGCEPTARIWQAPLRRFAPFLIAALATLVFHLPALTNASRNAGYMFSGDVLGFYWPSLLKIRWLIAHHDFTAIDYSLFNGSAGFFLTPNLFSVYPVFVLGSLCSAFFKVTAADLERLLTWTIAMNGFAACYFTIKLTVRYLRWDLWRGALAGCFFGFSTYVVSTAGEPQYQMCACMVPCIAYASLRFMETPGKSTFVLATLPVVFALLGGYLPMGLAATGFGLATALFALWYASAHLSSIRWSSLFRLALPTLASILITSPLMLDIHRFLMDSPSATAPGLFFSAHQFADPPQAILRAISFRLVVPGPFHESSATVGMIGLVILAMFFFRKDISDGFEKKDVQSILICIGLYSFFVLITYGTFSALSDAFFYFAPQLGKMHVYQRFLMMAHLFLAVAITMTLHGLLRASNSSGRTAMVLAVILLFTTASLVGWYPDTAQKVGLNNFVVFEVLCLFLFLAFYRTGIRSAVFLAALVLMNVPAMRLMYNWSLEAFNWSSESLTNPVCLDESVQNAIVQFMRSHSKKTAVKYVDLSPLWKDDKWEEVFPKSFPYWVEDKIALSSYHGFNYYLSSRQDYMSFMRVGVSHPLPTPDSPPPMALQPSWDWIEKTGGDYAVIEAAALEKGEVPEYLLDPDSGKLSLPNHLVLVPLRQGYIAPHDLYFDDGIVRVHRTGAKEGPVGNAIDLALNRPTSQSSIWGNYSGALAVDGNTNGDLSRGSVFHTLPEKSPWFEVDLGSPQSLALVRVWNRTDCCQERLNDFWIFVSDTPLGRGGTADSLARNPKTWSKHVISGDGRSVLIQTNGAKGRYLRLQADAPGGGTRMLHFAELEAYGEPANPKTDEAGGARAQNITSSGNFANHHTVRLETDRPVTAEYLMSYNPGLHFYLNGHEAAPSWGPGKLAKFDLAPGKNVLEVRFRDVLLSLFWVFYGAYGVAVAITLGRMGLLAVRAFRDALKVSRAA